MNCNDCAGTVNFGIPPRDTGVTTMHCVSIGEIDLHSPLAELLMAGNGGVLDDRGRWSFDVEGTLDVVIETMPSRLTSVDTRTVLNLGTSWEMAIVTRKHKAYLAWDFCSEQSDDSGLRFYHHWIPVDEWHALLSQHRP